MKNVMTKLKMSLTNNLGIKIIAIVVAAIIWLAVVNVNDPEKTVVIYNVPITMTNEDVITDLGMVYNLETQNNINITVSGKRSVVSELSADDFTATASLAELSKVNAIPVEVTAKKNSIARNVTIVKQSLNTVKVSVENIESQDFNIEVEFAGKAAEGYVAVSHSLSKNIVNIQAPESVLDRIEKVVAVCNLDSNASDMEQKCNLVLYDKRGKAVKSKNIKMSVKKVTVYVDILREKEVPINVSPIGNPAEGYRVADITLSSDTVKLVGTDEALEGVESVEVDGDISIAKQKSNITKKIDLKKYLPENVSINGETEIQVLIKIDKLDKKTYTISTKDISIENLEDGLSAKISGDSIKVTLQGEESVMDQIDADEIRTSIDLRNSDKGTSKVPVSIVIPEGTELVKDITVKVKIK